MKPAFLGIGAHKAGTTWLYHQLAAHPEIGFSVEERRAGRIAVKERHFWCRDQHDRRERPRWPGPLDQALVAYRARLPDGKISGDITPHYAILGSEVVSRVAEHLPGVRLLYLMREPRARAWSSAVSNYMETEAAVPGFSRSRRAQVWEAPIERESFQFDERAEDSLRNRLTGAVLVSHSDYADNITRWRRYFPEEAMLLATTDEVSADPRGLMRRIFHHVGADPAFADQMPDEELAAWVNPHRPAPRVPVSLEAVLDETYLPLVEPLERLTGWDLSRWKQRPAEYGE